MKAPDHSTPVLYPPIITGSERNLIRLRIWLANRVYRPKVYEICRFGPRSSIKFSTRTRAAEAANMEYIARNTTIPVPRVQDVFIINKMVYIVMDYIKEFNRRALSEE